MISKRSSANHYPKTAFTLVELLVVITIIGILIALLLPAVQAAREAARRMQCGNNLKQLALAVLNYESACTRFPAGVTAERLGSQSRYNIWTVRVMPYMELTGIYDQWDFNKGYGLGVTSNTPLMEIKVPAFCCPSDTTVTATYKTGKDSRSNYVGCFSPSGKMVEPDAEVTFLDSCYKGSSNPSVGETPRRKAIFNFNVYRDISAVSDGLSNTIAISEGSGTQNDLRGCWWHSWGAQYSHHRTPNTLTPDDMYPASGYCDSTPDAPCSPSTCGETDIDLAARSKHPGGVMAARIDGSVDFYSNDVTLAIWQALGSINGGETP